MCYRIGFIFFMSIGFSSVVMSASLVESIKVIKPSIVGIATYQPTRRPPTRLLGTGFVIGDGHYIGTNAHVVSKDLDRESFERLVVLSGSGKDAEMHAATVVSKNQDRDLVILRIDQRLPALELASDRLVEEGEVFAFTGYPIGIVLGLYPVTHRGMVSSLTPIAISATSSSQLSANRILRLRDPVLVYQLDATAYPGNSGSPLYTTDTGEVVGILNMVFVKSTKEDVLSKPSGISYAIPVKYLRALLEEIEKLTQ